MTDDNQTRNLASHRIIKSLKSRGKSSFKLRHLQKLVNKLLNYQITTFSLQNAVYNLD